MTFVVVTPPSVEPVSIDEVRYFCRIDEYNQELYEDTVLLNTLISTARRYAETELKRYLITQTVDAYFDGFPESKDGKTSVIKLPPMQSVSAITYIDTSGDEQTLSASKYLVDSNSIPSRITESYSNTWPSIRNQTNAVKVRFVAGYGDAADVPQCIKQWIMMRVKQVYDNRDAVNVGNIVTEFPYSYVDGLLDPERVHGYL